MDYFIATMKTVAMFMAIINLIPLLIWLERKGAAYIQDRRGPNLASIAGIRLGGMVHSLTDVIKLITKEDIIPSHVNKVMYHVAPMLAMFLASVTMAVIPFAAPVELASGELFHMQIADLDVGLLYVFAMSSLGVYGVMLAGWASNNKYTLLGGLRASSQMISYEISMGLSVIGIFLAVGSLRLSDIVAYQGANVFHWNFILQPVAFVLFLVAAFAETNRMPFDLPEGEAEIVAGYHTEYSSMKFALFFMAEYAHMIVAAAIITTLFFGGWHIPFVSADWIREQASDVVRWGWLGFAFLSIAGGYWLTTWFRKGKYGDLRDYEPLVFGVAGMVAGALLLLLWVPFGFSIELGDWGSQLVVTISQLGTFLAKVLFFCFFFVWVRWTLPRFRFDQLMTLGWKIMLPLALANVMVTAGVLLLM